MELLTTIYNPDDTTFTHYPTGALAGCYIVSAVDSFQNESAHTNKVCVDNCDYYSLPNTFSPNEDGINDLFIPFPYQFIEKVEMTIYNRWGSLVFKTDDPDINWDGRDIITNQKVSSGVYYYVCDIWEYRLTGLELRNITGFINVFTGDVESEGGK